MRRIIYICMILVLIFSDYSISQQQDSWMTFTTEDGLGDNRVFVIIEDNEGTLWLGTDGGGVTKCKEGMLKTLNKENSGLTGNSIYTILMDSNGDLWFGSLDAGVCKYNFKKDQWTAFNKENSELASNSVRAIVDDGNGDLWFATSEGVSKYDGIKWENYNTQNSDLADDNVTSIIEDSHGALWFGTYGGGLSKFEKGIWNTYNEENSDISRNYIRSIFNDSKGILWIGTSGAGVSKYDDGTWETYNKRNSGLSGDEIFCIFEDNQGILWFGTQGGGVNTFHDNIWESIRQNNSGLANNDVRSITEDKYGAIWFGTDDGVNRYEEAIWQNFNKENSGLAYNVVCAILEDSHRELWFATMMGLNRYKEGIWETFNIDNSGLSSIDVRTIIEDNQGALWFGTHDQGVSCYNANNWYNYNKENSGLADNRIQVILEDCEGSIWFGTAFGGVSKYKDSKWENYNSGNSDLADDNVTSIIEDSQGALWFGTWGGGVNRYINGKWESINANNSKLPDNYITTIMEDSKETLWFGISNKGVCNHSYYKGTWEFVNTENSGLINDDVATMIEDSQGALWFGTAEGVSRYQNSIWENFHTGNSALVHNNISAIIEDNQNTMWFGTWGSEETGGVSSYKGDKIPPFIRIIKYPQQFTGNPSPFFTFRGKDYQTEDSRILYSYAVVDFSILPNDIDYSSYFNETFIEIPPLQNGKYTFYVRARDKMVNISKPANYTFTVDITPPTLFINSPKQGQHISSKFVIIGYAFDNSPIKDFDYYKLYYGAYVSEIQEPEWKEDRFTNIKSYEVRNDTLGIFNTIGLADGHYQIKLWAIDTLKHESEDRVLVTIDNTKPMVEITSPEAGDKVSKKIDIYATINDVNIEKYSLEYKIVHQTKWQYLHQDTLGLSIENQLIYTWENLSDSGDVYLKLTAWDKAGNSTSDTVLFVLDNKESHLPTANILSPLNNAYLHDFVRIKGYATDKNFTKYTLSLIGENIDTLLIESDKKKENDVLFTLDTKSFPDDMYKIYLTVLNDRQYQKTDSISITIDNTLPVAKITSPLSDTISCYALIQGEANDVNLKGLTLKYAKVPETDSSKFMVIDTAFVYWNTMELNGYYTLYLMVEDRGGLKNIDKRTYYIENPIFNQRTGLKKNQGEFSLYIPPNGYPASVICIEKRGMNEFTYNPEEITPTDLICQIHSSIEETQFNKPAVFTIDYTTNDLSQFDESKLRVFSWENDNWKLVGGTLDEDKKIITTAIHRIGIYGLFECQKEIETSDKGLQANCQPRMFSPKGGGYSTETNISFYLGKDSNVTIKIFNLAGRLVNMLCENKFMTSGMNSIVWDGKDNSDSYCISGLYVVVIQAEEENATKTVMVLNK